MTRQTLPESTPAPETSPSPSPSPTSKWGTISIAIAFLMPMATALTVVGLMLSVVPAWAGVELLLSVFVTSFLFCLAASPFAHATGFALGVYGAFSKGTSRRREYLGIALNGVIGTGQFLLTVFGLVYLLELLPTLNSV